MKKCKGSGAWLPANALCITIIDAWPGIHPPSPGFHGEAKQRLLCSVAALGGMYSGELRGGSSCAPGGCTTHLVCASMLDSVGSAKFVRALEWGIPIVTARWLADSVAAGRVLPADEYNTDAVGQEGLLPDAAPSSPPCAHSPSSLAPAPSSSPAELPDFSPQPGFKRGCALGAVLMPFTAAPAQRMQPPLPTARQQQRVAQEARAQLPSALAQPLSPQVEVQQQPGEEGTPSLCMDRPSSDGGSPVTIPEAGSAATGTALSAAAAGASSSAGAAGAAGEGQPGVRGPAFSFAPFGQSQPAVPAAAGGQPTAGVGSPAWGAWPAGAQASTIAQQPQRAAPTCFGSEVDVYAGSRFEAPSSAAEAGGASDDDDDLEIPETQQPWDMAEDNSPGRSCLTPNTMLDRLQRGPSLGQSVAADEPAWGSAGAPASPAGSGSASPAASSSSTCASPQQYPSPPMSPAAASPKAMASPVEPRATPAAAAAAMPLQLPSPCRPPAAADAQPLPLPQQQPTAAASTQQHPVATAAPPPQQQTQWQADEAGEAQPSEGLRRLRRKDGRLRRAVVITPPTPQLGGCDEELEDSGVEEDMEALRLWEEEQRRQQGQQQEEGELEDDFGEQEATCYPQAQEAAPDMDATAAAAAASSYGADSEPGCSPASAVHRSASVLTPQGLQSCSGSSLPGAGSSCQAPGSPSSLSTSGTMPRMRLKFSDAHHPSSGSASGGARSRLKLPTKAAQAAKQQAAPVAHAAGRSSMSPPAGDAASSESYGSAAGTFGDAASVCAAAASGFVTARTAAGRQARSAWCPSPFDAPADGSTAPAAAGNMLQQQAAPSASAATAAPAASTTSAATTTTAATDTTGLPAAPAAIKLVGLAEMDRWQRQQEGLQDEASCSSAGVLGSPGLEQLLQQTIHHNHAATQKWLQASRVQA